jgi:release factor glutamine methyltransferase
MLTVLESLKLSTEYLNKKGIESPRLNAELLLADILGLKRLELYLQYERPLSEAEKSKYREYLARRGNREPLQYILGYAEFMGEKFKVNKNVLIPRPETELLVEKIVNENLLFGGKILDIGSGSGNIAIMLAKALPEAEIFSIDVSEKAIEIAKENARTILKDENRVNFIRADFINDDILSIAGTVDIIVSNPPYIAEEELKSLEPEVKDHEPSSALTDGGDGFLFFKTIARKGKDLLSDKGLVYLELGAGQSERVKSIFEENGYQNVEIIKDYAGIERILKAVKK